LRFREAPGIDGALDRPDLLFAGVGVFIADRDGRGDMAETDEIVAKLL
jgi:hypothetical protein